MNIQSISAFNQQPNFEGVKAPLNRELYQRVYYLKPVMNATQDILNSFGDNLTLAMVNKIKSDTKLVRWGDSIQKGFVFSRGEKNIKILLDKENNFVLQEQDVRTGKINKNIKVDYKFINEKTDHFKDESSLLKFFTDNLDFVDYLILQIRKNKDKYLAKDYFEQAMDTNDREKTILKMIYSKNRKEAKLSPKVMALKQEIEALYDEIRAKIAGIKNPNTKTLVRNSYYAIREGGSKDHSIEFLNVGEYGENLVVNKVKSHNKPNLIIGITLGDKSDNIIFREQNALKECALASFYNTGSKTVYYTKEEMEQSHFIKNLEFARNELMKYRDYINDRINLYKLNLEKYNMMVNRNNVVVGAIDDVAKENLDSAYSAFKEYKSLYAKKIHTKPQRNNFKTRNSITIPVGHNGVILNKVGPCGEDIFVDFPLIKDRRFVKIGILQKGEECIKKMYMIDGDKVVKNHADRLKRSIRADRPFVYYSKEEINDEEINKITEVVKNRLMNMAKYLNEL